MNRITTVVHAEITRLSRDRRGAVMLLGVFMAVFLAAILYHMIGIAEALHHRQRMQDAVDAAAFSAAVVHARGMNVIVLINIIMAALLAVIVALKLIETLIIAAITLITVLSFFSAGALAGAIPELEMLRRNVNREAESAKKVIFPQLKVLNKAARGVRSMIPFAAEIKVVDTVVGYYNPPAHVGFVIPNRWTLPTANDRFNVLCEKAGNNVGNLVAMPFRSFGGELGDVLGDAIRDASGSVAASLSQWFCGKGEPSFNSVKLNYTEKLPLLQARKSCIEYGESIKQKSYDKYKHQKICETAEKRESVARPQESGFCRYYNRADEETKCGPYWELMKQGRIQCDPNFHRDLNNYQWQEQTVQIYYRYEGAQTGWVRVQNIVDSRIESGRKPPCENKNWNRDIGESSHQESLSVCIKDKKDKCEAAPPDRPKRNQSRLGVRLGETTTPCVVTRVAQIIGCERRTQRSLSPKVKAKDKLSKKDKKTRAIALPQKVEDNLELGSEAFQMRAVVVGRRGSMLSANAQRIVEMAGWGRNSASMTNLYEKAAILGQLSLAQAEYYYAGTESRKEWMWHMNWRARLKRFRLPANDKKDKGTFSKKTAADRRFVDNRQGIPEDISQAYSRSAQKSSQKDKIQNIKKYITLLDGLISH